ncbi:MAG TPA: hypothetical protein VIO60_07970, partial [Rectinemataceae bacterium]
RPRDDDGKPGGLVRLHDGLVFILPDLHARTALLSDVLESEVPGTNLNLAELMAAEKASLVCLGDVLHTEGAEAAARWEKAARRALSGARDGSRGDWGLMGPEMEEEMGYSLKTLALAAGLQAAFPGRFICLKGNHDNMCNRSDHGDQPFYKYANEGSMGAAWFRERYGLELCELVRAYELCLPLLAAGRDFCASHAEPGRPLQIDDLVKRHGEAEIGYSLIWTRNGEAEPGALAASMESILGAPSGTRRRLWAVGHTALSHTHALRGDGLLQIHSRCRRQVLALWNGFDSDSPAEAVALGGFPLPGIFAILPGGRLSDFIRLSLDRIGTSV